MDYQGYYGTPPEDDGDDSWVDEEDEEDDDSWIEDEDEDQ